MLTGLAQLHLGLRAVGHQGINVSVFDHDTVSVSNVGRQMFYQGDVGHYKAIVLTNRVNACYGLQWKAYPTAYPGESNNHPPCDILITCVDSAKARREIHKHLFRTTGYCPAYYWLDLGNRQHDGQVVLGQTRQVGLAYQVSEKQDLLPCITHLFPEILDDDFEEADLPSCSLAEALQRQDLLVNSMAATHALNILWRLLRYGGIEFHAVFFNLLTGQSNPVPVPNEKGGRIRFCEGVTQGNP
jgi:PRTRC genetic system ThiF family protein